MESRGGEDECQRCVRLEEEKEVLQTSLFALTTHFAQIQFRLRQVCDAPFEEQEELLKSLEDFAFSDITLIQFNEDVVEIFKERRLQQKHLLDKLKVQLKELKKFDERSGNWEQLLELLRKKDETEKQLRGQILDLKRYVERLTGRCVCNRRKKTLKSYILEVVERSFQFLQFFALVQFAWGSNCFTLRATINHWGDLRAKLELAIIDLTRLLKSKEDPRKITLSVRKNLAVSIRDLMQHGTRSHGLLSSNSGTIHSWDIVLYYYHFQKGDEFNSSTAQTLSRSYNLAIAGVSPHTNLLATVERIIASHSRYKRSNDSHFKAFVCAALNARRLVSWLSLIFCCSEIVDNCYYPWSYVARTRYQDGLRSLDALTHFKFHLPVDLDVQKFQIEDSAFV